jgi:D-lactate dehydrogenase
MRVTFFSTKPFEEKFLAGMNEGRHNQHFLFEPLNLKTAALATGSQAVSLFSNDDASAPVLELLHELGIKFITLRSAGYDHVSLEKAKQLGIKVANVPEYSPYAIAEHSVAMMLSMNRKLIEARKKIQENDFRLDDLIGFDMNGKTAGIIGTGHIGGIVAKILHGFGCKILAYDINPDNSLTEKYGVEYTSLESLCKSSDIISIHCPLNEATKYMINKENLSLMKNGVMIVNTARGAVLKTSDAIEALKSGKIGYLGLDVYEKEKGLFFYDHSNEILQDDVFARLLSFKNVMITGHQAFLTETALSNIAETTLSNLDNWETGQDCPNELWQ